MLASTRLDATSADVAQGRLGPGDVDERALKDRLWSRELPDPDLLIRTSGELRISNFYLWELAYTELYFTDTLWPDFRRAELAAALEDYRRRDRRFGLVAPPL